MSAAIGHGTLRRDTATPQAYAGRAVIAGFPYLLSATVECDADGRYLALRFAVAPGPQGLRIPPRDDEAAP